MNDRRFPFREGQNAEAPVRGRSARPFAGPCIWLEGFVKPRGGMKAMESTPRPEMLGACGLG